MQSLPDLGGARCCPTARSSHPLSPCPALPSTNRLLHGQSQCVPSKASCVVTKQLFTGVSQGDLQETPMTFVTLPQKENRKPDRQGPGSRG